jgi:hypothetical protein
MKHKPSAKRIRSDLASEYLPKVAVVTMIALIVMQQSIHDM